MITWFKSLTITWKLIAGAFVLLAIWIAVVLVLSRAEKAGRTIGKTETQLEQRDQALENVKEANDAEDSLDNRTPAAVQSDCVRWARNPGNCGVDQK